MINKCDIFRHKEAKRTVQPAPPYGIIKPCDFPLDFSIDSYQLPKISPQQILHDGDCLDLVLIDERHFQSCLLYLQEYLAGDVRAKHVLRPNAESF